LGADWVARLGDSLRGSLGRAADGGVVVVNAGVSGQLAAAVASRVEACVTACSGRVVGVFVMAGTNDVLAACAGRAAGRKKKRRTGTGTGGGRGRGSENKGAAPSLLLSLLPGAARRSLLLGSLVRLGYRTVNALPRAPLTRPAALAAVAAALDAAALAAPGAALAVATIPPLGSGRDGGASRANAAVRDLNRGIRCVASARPRVSLLDVHAALSAAFLASAREGNGGRGAASSSSSRLLSADADADADADAGEGEEEEEEEQEEDISLSAGPSCLASVLLRVAFRISWDRAAQWKAFPAAAAAAATSLPQRALSSSLLGRWGSRAPASSSSSAAAAKKRATSFSSNSLLHDGVHFGETAAACVLALVLPWARRAARGRNGGGSSFSSSSSSSSFLTGDLRSGGSGTGLATALSLAGSPPSPSRRRGAVVAASTSRSVSVAASAPPRESGGGSGSSSNGNGGNGGTGRSSTGGGGGKAGGGVSGALASAAIRLLASSR